MTPSPVLATVAEAAATLAVSTSTIRRMCASGELRTVRIARRVVRIPRVDIDRLTTTTHPNPQGETV